MNNSVGLCHQSFPDIQVEFWNTRKYQASYSTKQTPLTFQLRKHSKATKMDVIR